MSRQARVPHTRLSMAEVADITAWLRRILAMCWSNDEAMTKSILGKFEDWFNGRTSAHKLSVAELEHILAHFDHTHSAHEKLARRLHNLRENYVKQRKKRHIRSALVELKGKNDETQ